MPKKTSQEREQEWLTTQCPILEGLAKKITNDEKLTEWQVEAHFHCLMFKGNQSANFSLWMQLGTLGKDKISSKDKGSVVVSIYSSRNPDRNSIIGPWIQDLFDSKKILYKSFPPRAKDPEANKNEEGKVVYFEFRRVSALENNSPDLKNFQQTYGAIYKVFSEAQNKVSGTPPEPITFNQKEENKEKVEKYLTELQKKKSASPDDHEPDIVQSVAPSNPAVLPDDLPRNLIYFGAPGTGKSHQLKIAVEGKTDKDGKVFKDIEQNIGVFVDVDNNKIIKSRYERVTFYPTYSYAQFVGCYKPVMEGRSASGEDMSASSSIRGLTIDELAQKLRQIYDASESGEPGQTAAVLLFAEQYIDALNAHGKGIVKKVVEKAELPASAYSSWLSAGIRLATFRARQNTKTAAEEIAYKFVPGPFLRILVKALKKPQEQFCLVIEEINRANAAAVFGDVFQLLDRGGKWNDVDDESIKPFFGDGAASEYDVAASEDIKRYLKEELAKYESARKFLKVVPGKDENGNNIWKECRLRIPSNMYIWATMNSADQGVFPMDTAFKRRWEFKYVGIDEGYNKQGDKGAPSEWVVGDSGYYWDQIRRFVNKQLSDNGVNEDKLMGPWFVKPENNKSVSADQFKSKVLMYLWEDAGRMCRKKLFGDKIKTYSDIVDTWPEAKDVFKNVTDKDDENWKAPWNKTGEHA